MVEKIESLGAECWLDEKELAGGDVIVEDIIRGIDACHEAYCADFARQFEVSVGAVRDRRRAGTAQACDACSEQCEVATDGAYA
jgi:hypothetical protein